MPKHDPIDNGCQLLRPLLQIDEVEAPAVVEAVVAALPMGDVFVSPLEEAGGHQAMQCRVGGAFRKVNFAVRTVA